MNYPIALFPLKAKVIAFAAFISGLFGFTLTELFTNQYFLASLIGIFSSIGGAVLVSIPRIINARTGARDSDAAISAGLWARADAFNRDQIQFFQNRLASKELVSVLERRSKHKVVSECQRLTFHINLLEGMLRAAGAEPPDFTAKTYDDLVGEEDRLIEAQAELRVAETKIMQGPPNNHVPINHLPSNHVLTNGHGL